MSFSNLRMKIIEKILLVCKKKPAKAIQQLDDSDVKRILIVSNKLLGDFLFCTPAIASLKEKYPQAEIMAVLSAKNRGIVDNCAYINQVVYMENQTVSTLKAIPSIRKFRPELAVIFHSRTPYDLIAATLGGCKYIAKHYFNNDIKKLIPLCDIHVIDKTRPPVINHLSLVKALGCNIDDKKMFFPCRIAQKQPNKSINVGFQLGASKSNRYLPNSVILPLIPHLLARFNNCQIHLFGAPHEAKLGEDFIAGLDEACAARVINHIGKTTLPMLAHRLNEIDILITPDTGTLHVATALQVKTVSLFTRRQSNGCEPVQDRHLHRVVYAADFNPAALDRSCAAPFTFIPSDYIWQQISELLDDEEPKNAALPVENQLNALSGQ